MPRHRTFLALAAALSLCGCATTGFQPVSPTMSAAKVGLEPEFRIFYDALEDYGDWILIEPYGYVFRPRVSFVAWRPYQEGFWVPSDIWGWVWISGEPFGWATYHYGVWMYDRFQGWVWNPGLDWGPAWVSWEATDQYVGWAPLGPRGQDFGGAPGGSYTYVPMSQLASTNLKAQIVPAEKIAEQIAIARPVQNMVERSGVTINRGPRFDLVERVAGPLTRVKLAEVTLGGGGKRGPGAGGATSTIEQEIEATQRAAEEAARQARTVAEGGGSPPSRLSMVRPVLTPAPVSRVPGGRDPGRGKTAAPDSTR